MARLVPAAAEAGKVGNVFIVNRLTGKLLRKSEPFVLQSANMFMKPPTDDADHHAIPASMAAACGRRRPFAAAPMISMSWA